MEKLTLAIQKSGRLFEGSIELLKQIDIKLASSHNKLKADAVDFPLQVLFIRDDDIPQYVAEGVADIGIVGENVLIESKEQLAVTKKLGFSKCRLSLAVPKATEYSGPEFFQNKRIATSYPTIVQNYFDEKGIQTEIHEIAGSVEIAPSIGLAEGICDIVSSGSTLFMNSLKETDVILQSEAVLVQNEKLNDEKSALINDILFRIEAVKRSKQYKYLLMNVPNEKLDKVIETLPGMKSPTVMPLARTDWSSVHTVIEVKDFWNLIQQLEAEGAEGMLILPIEKMVY